MKKLLTRLFLLSVMAFMSMAVAAQTDAEYKRMIESNNKMIGEAMKAGDLDRMMTVYADDAIQLPNNEKMVRGASEIRRAQEMMMREGWKVKEYTTNVEKVEAHGDLVTEIGTYSITGMKEGTDETFSHDGKYVCLWEKQKDGTLKLTTEIWNHDEDNSGMAEANENRIDDPTMDDKMKDRHKEMHKDMDKDKSDMSKDKSMEDQSDDNR